MSRLPDIPLEQPATSPIGNDTPATGTCIEAEPFALQVLDDAMAPEFPAGCVIIVDPTGVARDGAYVLAEVADELYLRRLAGSRDAGFRLLAEAEGLPAMDLEAGLGAIRGVVTQRAGRRRSQHKRYD